MIATEPRPAPARYERMPTADLAALVARAQAGDDAARDRLLAMSWKLLAHMASNVARHHAAGKFDLEELTNVGAAAITRALRSFDPSRGIRFTTYFQLIANGAMRDFIRAMDPVPRLTRERSRRMDRHRDTFRAEHGRDPTDAELQHATGLDDHRYAQHAQAIAHRTECLDAPMRRGHAIEAKSIASTLAAPSTAALTDAKLDARHIVRHTLERYGLRAALMLKLNALDGWTHKRIGTAFMTTRAIGAGRTASAAGLSESLISQRMRALLDTLRADFADDAANLNREAPCR